MNDIQHLIARPDFLTAITAGLSEAPVVALLGARQVGETGRANVAPPIRGVRLEIAADRQASGAAPKLRLRDSEGSVVTDEVHCRSVK